MSMRPRFRRDVLRPLKWSRGFLSFLFFAFGVIVGWCAAFAFILWYFDLF